jgi:hypothetical protein
MITRKRIEDVIRRRKDLEAAVVPCTDSVGLDGNSIDMIQSYELITTTYGNTAAEAAFKIHQHLYGDLITGLRELLPQSLHGDREETYGKIVDLLESIKA